MSVPAAPLATLAPLAPLRIRPGVSSCGFVDAFIVCRCSADQPYTSPPTATGDHSRHVYDVIDIPGPDLPLYDPLRGPASATCAPQAAYDNPCVGPTFNFQGRQGLTNVYDNADQTLPRSGTPAIERTYAMQSNNGTCVFYTLCGGGMFWSHVWHLHYLT